MSSPLLSIVFLNFNRLNETQFTVEQLRKQCLQRDDIEIIAVDNGSVDGTAEYLQQQTDIINLCLDDNTGIAGYNQGFELATGRYILVLDDDSCLDSLQSIDNSLKLLENSRKIGLIACHIETPDGLPQWSWHLPIKQQSGESPFFIGCGFIIRRELFKKIGWYPADFFLYQNEVAVSFEVRRQGYEIFYDPECLIIHRGRPNQRPGWRRVFFPTRNTLWLLRRYYPQPQASYLIFSRLVIGLVRAISFGEVKTYLKAVREGLMQPIQKTPLSAQIRQHCLPFWKQNSLIHQLLKRT